MPVVILVHRLPRLAVIEERRGEKSSSSSSLGAGVQMLFVTLGTSQSGVCEVQAPASSSWPASSVVDGTKQAWLW